MPAANRRSAARSVVVVVDDPGADRGRPHITVATVSLAHGDRLTQELAALQAEPIPWRSPVLTPNTEVHKRADALSRPPCSVPAFRHGTTQQLGPASVSYTCLYNLLAHPAR